MKNPGDWWARWGEALKTSLSSLALSFSRELLSWESQTLGNTWGCQGYVKPQNRNVNLFGMLVFLDRLLSTWGLRYISGYLFPSAFRSQQQWREQGFLKRPQAETWRKGGWTWCPCVEGEALDLLAPISFFQKVLCAEWFILPTWPLDRWLLFSRW